MLVASVAVAAVYAIRFAGPRVDVEAGRSAVRLSPVVIEYAEDPDEVEIIDRTVGVKILCAIEGSGDAITTVVLQVDIDATEQFRDAKWQCQPQVGGRSQAVILASHRYLVRIRGNNVFGYSNWTWCSVAMSTVGAQAHCGWWSHVH